MTMAGVAHTSRSRGAIRPRFARYIGPLEYRGRREDRVRAAPAVSCANAQRKRTRAYRFSGGIRPSLRNGFTAYNALSSATGFLATVISRALPQDLTPASGRQDHTTSPSASVPFVNDTSASTASHRAFRDDREPPLLSGETGELIALICPTG